MQRAELQIEEASADKTPIVRLKGATDIENSPRLREVLKRCQKFRPAAMLVDLAGLERMDTSGLATLVECALSLREHGGRLLVAGMRNEMADDLSLAQIRHVLQLFDDEAAALSAIGASHAAGTEGAQ